MTHTTFSPVHFLLTSIPCILYIQQINADNWTIKSFFESFLSDIVILCQINKASLKYNTFSRDSILMKLGQSVYLDQTYTKSNLVYVGKKTRSPHQMLGQLLYPYRGHIYDSIFIKPGQYNNLDNIWAGFETGTCAS